MFAASKFLTLPDSKLPIATEMSLLGLSSTHHTFYQLSSSNSVFNQFHALGTSRQKRLGVPTLLSQEMSCHESVKRRGRPDICPDAT